MMNLRRIERIAAQLENELGLNDAGNELIDKAEEEVAKSDDNLQESIDENIEQEKQEESLPESPLEACDGEKDEAKACIASMKKLLKIAKAVKMSKDMPACKKQEVLSRIQKASDKMRKAAGSVIFEDDGMDADEPVRLTNTNSRKKEKDDAANRFIQFLMSRRSALTKLLNGAGKTQQIANILGTGVMGITTTAGRLTPLQLIHILKALLNQ